jgi:putative ABC transport system ATP-binding protein
MKATSWSRARRKLLLRTAHRVRQEWEADRHGAAVNLPMSSAIDNFLVPAKAGATESVIRVEDVHKYYELGETRVHALRGINIAINRGEFVAVMGASGSGKSTFMNILGCLDKPSSGRYLLEDIDVSSLTKRDLALIRNRRIGFVFQGFNLLARTTALENVELPTLYARIERVEREKRAKQALELVGLGERIDHFPSQLSGGQQQRVAIARALVNKPSILLADEPTGNLDSRTSVEIMDIFQQLNDQGLTIVLVTHEPDIAQFAKRELVFRDGKVRKDDPIKNRPRAADVVKAMPTIEDD